MNKQFSLVLSGGGALGISQVGILKQLEEKNFIPSEIIGTSIGSIIGSAFAIGKTSSEILDLLNSFSHIVNWAKFSFSGNSIINSSKIEKILDTVFSNLKIKDSKIKLKIIATNLSTGIGESLNEELLIKDAILASIAIPGIFNEKQINNTIYVDGFLSDNLGINFVSFKKVLAVDVLGYNSYEPDLPNKFIKTQNVLAMFEKSMRLLVYNQTRRLISNHTCDITLIDINTKDFKTYHFNKVKELYLLGLNKQFIFLLGETK